MPCTVPQAEGHSTNWASEWDFVSDLFPMVKSEQFHTNSDASLLFKRTIKKTQGFKGVSLERWKTNTSPELSLGCAPQPHWRPYLSSCGAGTSHRALGIRAVEHPPAPNSPPPPHACLKLAYITHGSHYFLQFLIYYPLPWPLCLPMEISSNQSLV